MQFSVVIQTINSKLADLKNSSRAMSILDVVIVKNIQGR
jgi:hypothetical protein